MIKEAFLRLSVFTRAKQREPGRHFSVERGGGSQDSTVHISTNGGERNVCSV
jgi:hypothetical protein